MSRLNAVLSFVLVVGAGNGMAAQIPRDQAAPPSRQFTPCVSGGPSLPYWRCMAARLRAPVHTLSRRDLPHDALRAAMRAGDVWITSGATDSIYWYLTVSAHGVDTRNLPAEKFHAGPTATGYELSGNVPDSFPQRPSELVLYVPKDLKVLQVDVGDGDVRLFDVSSEVAVTVEKGRVDVGQLAGPALIENRDGAISVSLGALPWGQTSALTASLSVLGRNGDVGLSFPASSKASLNVEAPQGVVVDAPFGITTRPGDGDTVTIPLRPVLGLRDNELRTLHRAINGGGPNIKLVALNGNVTLRELVAAREPAAVPLKPANATLDLGFPNGIRELRDGRALFGVANGLLVADFTTGRTQLVAGETTSEMPFNNYYKPFASGGDSTVTVNIAAEQWVVFDGPRIVSQILPSSPLVRATVRTGFVGFDGHGSGILLQRNGPGLYVMRVSLATGAKDTITRLKDLPTAPDGRRMDATDDLLLGYVEKEHAVAGPDGWIAIVRADPYRVDWLSPDGKWTLGAPIPTTPVPLNDREKQAYLSRNSAGYRHRMRDDSARHVDTYTSPEWPAVAPAFVSLVDQVAPNGDIAILRPITVDHPETRYDIVDHRGERVRTVMMPPNETIVGFGVRSVYVRVRATDGKVSVQRHPWP